MLRRCQITLVTLLFLVVGTAAGQVTVVDLGDVMGNKTVSLHAVTGNGSSTGSALSGYVVNNTQRALKISINLRNPLYFANGGPNQNMIALQVFKHDGSYYSDSDAEFVELEPRGRLNVVFNALCADYERGNPTSSDRFTVGVHPYNLSPVLAKIKAYALENPDDDDFIVAAQTAIWLANGISINDIRKRFEVSLAQERLARRFL